MALSADLHHHPIDSSLSTDELPLDSKVSCQGGEEILGHGNACKLQPEARLEHSHLKTQAFLYVFIIICSVKQN